ncbi:MAG: hypothetical protein AB8H47_18845 [Bacteroidia bacterium]
MFNNQVQGIALDLICNEAFCEAVKKAPHPIKAQDVAPQQV